MQNLYVDIEIEYDKGEKTKITNLPIQKSKDFKKELDKHSTYPQYEPKGNGSIPFRNVEKVKELRPDGSVNREIWSKDKGKG